MADTTYSIGIDTKEALGPLNALKSALGGIAAAFAIKESIQFADSITNLRNKLMVITPDLEAVNAQFKAIAGIAITARTPLDATADLFVKLQRSSKALGISQQEAADIR